MHTVLWIASALAIAWLVLAALSALARRNEGRALQRLKKAHEELSVEQKANRIAQRVAWYFSLPEDQQSEVSVGVGAIR